MLKYAFGINMANTEFLNRKLIDEIAALGMPYPEEVIINHGAALVIRGVRQERPGGDVDAATSLENCLYLQEELGFRAVQMMVGISANGKPRSIVSRRDPKGRFDIHRWDFSVEDYNRTGKGRIYLPELGANSDQDPATGIWVARPDFVARTMRDTGRPQDKEASRQIAEYYAQLR
jgi:hypothetical protein